MRNAALHRLLESYTMDASGRLGAEAAAGAEMPFELAVAPGAGSASLYCYRPLTGRFISARRSELTRLPSYEPAVRALAECRALDAYLAGRAERGVPADRAGRAQATLIAFLQAVFDERTGFGFEPAHFEGAYAELERAVYDRDGTATVVAPVLGVALDPGTTELALDDGVSLIRGDALAGVPAEAVWGDGDEPHVLALSTVDDGRPGRPPVPMAHARFRRILSALRLLQRGGYALGPVGWTRTVAGSWRAVSLGVSGRPRQLTLVPAAQEDELRAFYRLVARRPPGSGELAWALARFEMGCERSAPVQALTDYLLAIRALLEPEGPASGRLAQRLAVICARPDDQAGLAGRAADAISLERAAMTGAVPADELDPAGLSGAEALVQELAEHLRAILRDALCGHLDADLCSVADELLAEAVAAPAR